MEERPFQRPEWFSAYQMRAGNFSTIDQGTVEFLSKTFNCLPMLLVPVDYSAPLCTATELELPAQLELPPERFLQQTPPLPDPTAGACGQEPETAYHTAQASFGSSQEAELWELTQWFDSLSCSAQQEALAGVARSLYFPPDPPHHPQQHPPAESEPEPTLAQQLATLAPPGPAPPPLAPPPAPSGFTVYADEPLEEAPAAEPAVELTAPTMAAAPTSAAPASRPALGDLTNLQPIQGVTKASHIKELSSKLHVAHSQKATVPLPPEDVKALLDYQLRSSQPTRAPWWRGNQPRGGGLAKRSTAGEGGFTAAAAPSQVTAEPVVGTGAYVPLRD